MAAFNFLLVRWKRTPLAGAGAVSAVADAADAVRKRDPEEATRRDRRARELTGAERAAEFTAAYTVDRTFPLPLAPTSVEYQKTPATALRFTQDGTSIQRSVTRRVDIAVQGETGVRYRLGFDRDAIPMYQPGHELHKEFVGFLDDFYDGPSKGEDYRLTWHDFLHGRQYWVEPSAQSDGWDEAHPIGPKWSITLVGYHKSGYPNAGLAFALAIIPQVRDKLRIADRWANSLAAAAAVAETTLEGAEEVLQGVAGILDAIPRAIDATTAVLEDANNLERFPFEFWRDLASSTEAAIDRFNSELEDFDLLSSGKAEQIVTYRQGLRDMQRAIEIAAWAQKSSGLHSPESTPQSTYAVRTGDTLQGIAARMLGGAGRWRDIAVINGLTPPYVSLAGLPGTVGPGDKLVLPADATQSEQMQGAAQSDDEREFYGVDFAIDRNGRMPVEPGEYPADVQYVSGEQCVRQGLEITFRTTQGDDVYQPWFGVPAAVGDPSYEDAGLVLAQLVDQVLIDDRIAAVRRETAEESAGSINVSFDIHLKSGRRLTGITSSVGGAAA